MCINYYIVSLEPKLIRRVNTAVEANIAGIYRQFFILRDIARYHHFSYSDIINIKKYRGYRRTMYRRIF